MNHPIDYIFSLNIFLLCKPAHIVYILYIVYVVYVVYILYIVYVGSAYTKSL